MLFCLKVDREFVLVCVCFTAYIVHGRLAFLMLQLYMPADTDTDIRTSEGRIGVPNCACATIMRRRRTGNPSGSILGVYHVCIASLIYGAVLSCVLST